MVSVWRSILFVVLSPVAMSCAAQTGARAGLSSESAGSPKQDDDTVSFDSVDGVNSLAIRGWFSGPQRMFALVNRSEYRGHNQGMTPSLQPTEFEQPASIYYVELFDLDESKTLTENDFVGFFIRVPNSGDEAAFANPVANRMEQEDASSWVHVITYRYVAPDNVEGSPRNEELFDEQRAFHLVASDIQYLQNVVIPELKNLKEGSEVRVATDKFAAVPTHPWEPWNAAPGGWSRTLPIENALADWVAEAIPAVPGFKAWITDQDIDSQVSDGDELRVGDLSSTDAPTGPASYVWREEEWRLSPEWQPPEGWDERWLQALALPGDE